MLVFLKFQVITQCWEWGWDRSIWGWLVQEMSVSPSPPGSELLGLMSYSPVQSSCLPGAWGGENAQGKWKELDSAWVRLGLHAFRGACCEHTGVRV